MPKPIGGADRIASHHKHARLADRHGSSFLVDDPCLIALDHSTAAVRTDVMFAVRVEDMAGLRGAYAIYMLPR